MPRREITPDHAVRVMLAYFSGLTDPRIDRTKLHSLHSVIVLTLCGTICGADGWEALEEFAEIRADWFATFLDMPNGTPSADTFRRVFCAIDPGEFETQFRAWVRAMGGSLDGEVVAIDGKTVRGAVESATKGTALHLLHAWATEQQLLLAHCAVDGAPGEVQGITALLKLVDVRGAIITTDANGCTAGVTQAIREAGADYVLALKGNRSSLHKHVAEAFEAASAHGYRGIAKHHSKGTAHGRVEERTVRAMRLSELNENSQVDWVDLETIVQIDRTRTVGGETSSERHFYVTNLPPDAKLLARAIRAHWSVENQLHWCLDVGFDEDRRRVRDKRGAANLATIARFALAMLKRESTSKRGIAAKRRRAGWSAEYLLRVMSTGIAEV